MAISRVIDYNAPRRFGEESVMFPSVDPPATGDSMPVSKARNDADLTARWDDFLNRAPANEKTKIEKHLANMDAEIAGGHGKLWRRVAAELGTLTPLGVQSAGNLAWRFFVPDGKYRMQVFALEDPGDGTILVYLPDILTEAIAAKILAKTPEPQRFTLKGASAQIQLDVLSSADFSEPPNHFKAMLGWNRKALRLTLRTADADGPIPDAVCALFTLAAKRWAAKPAAAR